MENQPRWMRLDNAAKIYPAARRRSWSNLFRLSATLRETVEREVLQQALNKTVKRFPSIAVRVRRGMFWYYLEEIKQAPHIQSEHAYPLVRMPFDDIQKCAFRVVCYKNRIAVEFFHATTDGNGGLVFLKTLIACYLELKYGIKTESDMGVLDLDEPPKSTELEDSFLKNSSLVSTSRREATAYQLRGTPEPDGYLNLITGVAQVQDVLAKAKQYGVSLTAYMTAVMIYAIMQLQQAHIPNTKHQKPVKVLIPVNLRKLFDSETLRNFVLYITPGINPKMGQYTFEEIVKSIYHQMGVELNDKQMAARITTNVRTEQMWLLKVMPLFIKNLAMKAAFNLVGERKSSITISNLGEVHLPSAMQHYVTRFDFVLGAQAIGTNNCSMLSYDGKLYISLLRSIKEPALEQKFFAILREQGIEFMLESNQR